MELNFPELFLIVERYAANLVSFSSYQLTPPLLVTHSTVRFWSIGKSIDLANQSQN